MAFNGLPVSVDNKLQNIHLSNVSCHYRPLTFQSCNHHDISLHRRINSIRVMDQGEEIRPAEGHPRVRILTQKYLISLKLSGVTGIFICSFLAKRGKQPPESQKPYLKTVFQPPSENLAHLKGMITERDKTLFNINLSTVECNLADTVRHSHQKGVVSNLVR